MARVIKASEWDRFDHRRVKPLTLGPPDGTGQAIAEAQERARRIVAQSRAEAAILRLRAKEEGQVQGFRRGRQEGWAEGERHARQAMRAELAAETAKAVGLIRGVAEQMAEARSRIFQTARGELVRLATRLAERIGGHADLAAAGAIPQKIAEVVALAGQGPRIVVLFNPGELEWFSRRCGEFVDFLADSCNVELIADETVASGQPRLRTEQPATEAKVQVRLADLVDLVSRGQPGEQGTYVPVAEAERTAPAGAKIVKEKSPCGRELLRIVHECGGQRCGETAVPPAG